MRLVKLTKRSEKPVWVNAAHVTMVEEGANGAVLMMYGRAEEVYLTETAHEVANLLEPSK